MMSPDAPPPNDPPRAPHGYQEICAFYGWRDDLMLPDGQPRYEWDARMSPAALPAQLPFTGALVVTSVRVHRLIADRAAAVLSAVHDAGLWGYLAPYSGGYCFRTKRSSHQLSMHAFGAALDFNAPGNPMRAGIVASRKYAMPMAVVDIFRGHGWTWGGDFDDPMHFQYGSGY